MHQKKISRYRNTDIFSLPCLPLVGQSYSVVGSFHAGLVAFLLYEDIDKYCDKIIQNKMVQGDEEGPIYSGFVSKCLTVFPLFAKMSWISVIVRAVVTETVFPGRSIS